MSKNQDQGAGNAPAPAEQDATTAELLAVAKGQGASDEDLAKFTEQLAALSAEERDGMLEKLKGDPVPADKPKSKAKTKGKASTFHVTGPGSVRHDGENHAAGASLELTEDEAASLDGQVAPGAAPKPRKKPSGAGNYRLVGPGTISNGARFRDIGEEFTLTADEAKAFADRIEAC